MFYYFIIISLLYYTIWLLLVAIYIHFIVFYYLIVVLYLYIVYATEGRSVPWLVRDVTPKCTDIIRAGRWHFVVVLGRIVTLVGWGLAAGFSMTLRNNIINLPGPITNDSS